MTEKLLPCPFCGSAAHMEPWHGGAPTKQFIACPNDDCEVGPQVTGETPDEAIDRWNTRTAPPASGSGGDPALVGIAEEMKESGGHWQPCTGCYDTEDGHPTQKYDYSPALQTAIGCGCHECGGLGAVWWHMTDAEIASYAEDMDVLEDDAIDAIQRLMSKKGLTRKDLFPAKSRASECMSRKRPLSIAMIRKLHFEHGIPAEVLIAPYRIVTEGLTDEV